MSDDNLTVRVLIEIRDELRGTNRRLDQTNQRLDQTNERLDQTNVQIERQGIELRRELHDSEVRQATRMTELNASMRDTHDLFRDRFDLRDRVERCELDIADLKSKVG